MRGKTIIVSSRTDILVKVSKSSRQKMSRLEGDSNPSTFGLMPNPLTIRYLYISVSENDKQSKIWISSSISLSCLHYSDVTWVSWRRPKYQYQGKQSFGSSVWCAIVFGDFVNACLPDTVACTNLSICTPNNIQSRMYMVSWCEITKLNSVPQSPHSCLFDLLLKWNT